MYQLRFLIASPRKMSPHVFCHREYRGQRTQQDDFHSGFCTFVCQPKGDKTSQDIQLELFQSAAAHQPSAHLFPIVELFDPETGDRQKLTGTEIVLRPSDLAAAQEASSPITKAKKRDAEMASVLSDLQKHPSILLHFTPLLTADHSFQRHPDCQEWINAYHGQPAAEHPGKVLCLEAEDTDVFTVLKISLIEQQAVTAITSLAQNQVDPTAEQSAIADAVLKEELESIGQPGDEICRTPPIPTSLLTRLRAEITTNGKAQSTTLATTLGVDAALIKAAVAEPDSGLQNKGGWISSLTA